jgi:hypothetical protein
MFATAHAHGWACHTNLSAQTTLVMARWTRMRMWSLHISRRLCCPFKWSLHAQHSRTLDPATHLVRTRRTCCRTDTDTAVELACPALVAQSICAAPGSALGPRILQRTWRVHGVRAARWMQTQMRSFARLALLTLVIRATAPRPRIPQRARRVCGVVCNWQARSNPG